MFNVRSLSGRLAACALVALAAGALAALPRPAEAQIADAAPGWIIYALFWGLYGLVTPFVRDSH